MSSYPIEQVLAVQIAANTKDNLFITGAAGTGKSRVLKLIKTLLGADAIVVAVTGLSAMQVGGVTITSVFNKKKHSTYNLLNQGFSTLIIEEISMVSKEVFEHINKTLKSKRSSASAMGGVRIIALGDFYQLPPLTRQNNKVVTLPYACESNVWSQLKFRVVELVKPMRCSDDILSHIRLGHETSSIQERLLQLTISKYDAELLDDYVHLFFSKHASASYNNSRLNKLPGNACIFKAKVNDVAGYDFSNVPTVLAVKIGCRVMCIKNDIYREILVANGECGIVTNIIDNESIVVKMDNGKTVEFSEKVWYADIMGEKRKAIMQIPLMLAWGITINKSQGLTIDRVVAHLTKDMHPGQAYVAMSRVRSLENLKLVGYIPKTKCIKAPLVNFR